MTEISNFIIRYFDYLSYYLYAMLLCLIAVHGFYKKSRNKTYFISILIIMSITAINTYLTMAYDIKISLLEIPTTIILLIFYYNSIKLSKYKLSFVFFSAMLIPCIVSGIIRSFIYTFFPDDQEFSMFYTLLSIIGNTTAFAICYKHFKIRLNYYIENFNNHKIWKTLWMLPVTIIIVLITFFSLDWKFLEAAISFFIITTMLTFSSIAVYNFIFMMMDQTLLTLKLEAEKSEREKQLFIEQEEYRSLFNQIASTRAARHDLRHHLDAISSYLKNEDMDMVKSYVSNYRGSLPIDEDFVYCENLTINMILSHNANVGASKKIKCDFCVSVPPILPISDPDLWVIFGNCLENAIEACEIYQSKEKYIFLDAIINSNALWITISNSFDGVVEINEKGEMLSKKRNNAIGIGTKNVKSIVERYGGDMKMEWNDNEFEISISIPLNQS